MDFSLSSFVYQDNFPRLIDSFIPLDKVEDNTEYAVVFIDLQDATRQLSRLKVLKVEYNLIHFQWYLGEERFSGPGSAELTSYGREWGLMYGI